MAMEQPLPSSNGSNSTASSLGGEISDMDEADDLSDIINEEYDYYNY